MVTILDFSVPRLLICQKTIEREFYFLSCMFPSLSPQQSPLLRLFDIILHSPMHVLLEISPIGSIRTCSWLNCIISFTVTALTGHVTLGTANWPLIHALKGPVCKPVGSPFDHLWWQGLHLHPPFDRGQGNTGSTTMLSIWLFDSA